MSEYQWKAVSVVGFDELMEALERADRKGYMPDAVKEAWEGFNWKPAQQEPPTVAELVCVCGAEWEWRNRDWELVATPPAQRTWVGLTDEEMNAALDYWSEDERSAYGGAHAADGEYVSMIDTWRYIEVKLREKNT